jgi:serine/threonine protein phosphatase PrpC
MWLQVGAATDTGLVRKLNEDMYAVRAKQGLFVVCDGMGGAPAGEVASQIAAETIVRQLSGAGNCPASDTTHEHRYLPQTSRLAEAVRQSNHVIYSQAQKDAAHAGMGTTVVGVWIAQHVASVAHVGDSRAYLWHEHTLEPLTRDHSLVEANISAGLLDRDERLYAEQQNILLRVVGRECDVDVELNEVPVEPGDYLLLCSDGLTRMVPESILSQAVVQFRHPQRICDQLINLANQNGGADNITVVVVEVRRSLWERLSNPWIRSGKGEHRAEGHPPV